jgi:RND family efflux transporter MFP subunit
VATAQADVSAAAAGVSGARAKAQVATTSALQARAALTEASTIRGYTTIRSAVGGVVTARNISPGVLVQPGMSILKVAKINVVRIQANVSEADLAQIQPGQLLTAHAVDAPGRVITARVSAIFPAQDTTARTAIVEARVPNPGYLLKPGQYLSVNINLGTTARPALTAPTSALMMRDSASSVFIASNDGMRTMAKRVAVTTGRISNDRTEILTGLKDGDQVITSGLSNLHDGDTVTAVQQTSTPVSAFPMPPVSAKPMPTAGMAPKARLARTAKAKATPTASKPALKSPAARQNTTTGGGMKTAAGQPTKVAAKWYHCPMHLDMESNKPGQCPKCGMDYVVFEKK